MRAKIAFWAGAARAPFFTGVILPVALGTAAAWWHAAEFHGGLFALTLAGVVLIHAGANMANDYFDHLTGADEANVNYFMPFYGGSRMIQRGLITPRATLIAGLACLAGGAAAGIALTLLRGWPVLALGLAGGFFAFFYTAPPVKLSYRGLGEPAVALSFGVLMVAGAEYVQVQRITLVGLAASAPIALLIMQVLYVNQFPDAPSDGQVGKRNWVVRLGTRRARWGVPVIFGLTYAAVVAAAAGGAAPPWCLIGLLTAPLATGAAAVNFQYHDQPQRLPAASGLTIAAHGATGLLLAIGYILGGLWG